MAPVGRRFAIAAAAAVVAVVVIALTGAGRGRPGNVGEGEVGFDPHAASSPLWETALGGDSAGEPLGFADLAGRVDGLSDLEAGREGAIRLGRDVAHAAITGTGQDRFARYFSQNHTDRVPDERAVGCTQVRIHASSPVRMEVPDLGEWAKILVGFGAQCPTGQVERVAYVYAQRGGALREEESVAGAYEGWVPRHSVEVPGAQYAWASLGALPSEYELETLSRCSAREVRVRIEVALGYAGLCAAAEQAGIRLVAVEGLRSVEEQRALYRAERERAGSDAVARRRVAYADEQRCESRHCTGEAIDVETDERALAWLSTVVACVRQGRVEPLVTQRCADGSMPVDNALTHGFARPLPVRPGHLVWALGTTQLDAGRYGDCNPGAVGIEARIELMFTCRVLEAGFDEATAQQAAREAVQVARCASGLDPESRSQGGRFETRPDPVTGEPDDRAGLFSISRAAGEVWVAGGAASRREAGANIDAAARMWVHSAQFGRWGWSMFACATGSDGTTKKVL